MKVRRYDPAQLQGRVVDLGTQQIRQVEPVQGVLEQIGRGLRRSISEGKDPFGIHKLLPQDRSYRRLDGSTAQFDVERVIGPDARARLDQILRGRR